MDWDKVTENLREQVKFYAAQASGSLNSNQPGSYEHSLRWRSCADNASILLSAIRAGLSPK